MSKRSRRNHAPEFKGEEWPMAAVRNERHARRLGEALRCYIPARSPPGRNSFIAAAVRCVRRGRGRRTDPPVDVKSAARKDRATRAWRMIFLEHTRSARAGLLERKEMIDRRYQRSIARQAEALGISRGAVYFMNRARSPADFDPAHHAAD